MAMAYLERAHADNVIHTEMFFDPQTHTERGVAMDVVVNGLPLPVLESLTRAGRVTKSTAIGAGRYALELPLSEEPHVLLSELAGAGVRLVSAHPLRATLEDYFVEQVAAASVDRGLGPA